MSRLEHPVSQDQLMAFVDGELPEAQLSEIAEHARTCPDCAAIVGDARRLSSQLAEWKSEEPAERVSERVLEVLRQPRRRWFGMRPVFVLGGAFVALVFVFVILPPALLRSRQAEQSFDLRAARLPSAAMPSVEGFIGQGQQGQQAQQGQRPGVAGATPTGPMVIRTVTLTMITKEFDTARRRLDMIVMQFQGYVDRLTLTANPGAARRLSATLRLPAGQTDSGLDALKKLGQLTDEAQSSSDITSQYVDLNARLVNARNSEQRLLGLLRDRTGNLQDVVAMEREIASVRENIERMEAQQNDLNNKVRYSTIQIELTEEYRAQLEQPAPGTGTQLRNAFVDGIRSAADNTLGIAVFILRYGPALLIWTTFLAALAFVLWLAHRRVGIFRM